MNDPNELDLREVPGAYGQLAHHPSMWLAPAQRLLFCAHVLRERVGVDVELAARVPRAVSEFRGPELMLRGMGIECLLKAVHLEVSGLWRFSNRKDDGNFQGFKGHHKLVRIADAATVALDPTERRICEVLSHFIRWRPRFAVPLTNDEWDLNANWDPKWDPATSAMTQRFWRLAEEASDRAFASQEAESKERPTPPES